MGEKLRVKMWESLHQAVGAFLLPWQTRRLGVANAEVRKHDALMVAQTEREVEALQRGEIVYDTASAKFLPKPPNSADDGGQYGEGRQYREVNPILAALPKRATEQMVLNQVRRELNLIKAVQIAEENLEIADDASVTEESVEQDWIQQWRERAETVSSDQLRQLWGRILAGEVNKPGSYSLRTLSLLSNLSAQDAQLIELIGPLVVNGIGLVSSVFPKSGVESKFGVRLNDLILLDEMEIINRSAAVGGLEWKMRSNLSDRFQCVLECNGRGLLIEADDPNLELSFPIHVLTAVGKQIVQLATFVGNDEYLHEVGKFVAKRNQSFRIKIGDVSKRDNDILQLTSLKDLLI